MTTFHYGTQLRVITPQTLSFGVGTVVTCSNAYVTLQNRNDETVIVSTEAVKPLPTLLSERINDAVTGICAQIGMGMAMGQIPFVRTFADLHDHMDANVLVLNHLPEMFPRDADGDASDFQVDAENRVMEMVNAWLVERWDNDPINQPAPDTDDKVASILHAMLNMSTEEQQWGNAKTVEVLDGFGPDQVRLRIADHTFTIRVTRED